MAKCDLSIELDDPGRVYISGETITGTVHVDVDADVKCKGLVVETNWRTHGRGNVASGNSDSVTVFTGDWTGGQKLSYRFELKIANWPPSYHGNFINLDHYVDVRAKIPWAFDPKASAEFVMRPAPHAEPTEPDQSATVGCVTNFFIAIAIAAFACALLAVVVAAFANLIVAAVMLVVILLIAGGVIAKFWLPKWALGPVETQWSDLSLSPGGTLKTKIAFEPRRQVSLNNITAKLSGSEVCVSGSGSNRRTHTNGFYEKKHELLAATTLEPGTKQAMELELVLPGDVPYSFDVSNNKILWQVELRIDIPRWPDWSETKKLQIVPGEVADDVKTPSTQTDTTASISSQPTAPSTEVSAAEITFAETASHFWKAREAGGEQIDVLVDATSGMTFEIDAFIERRLLYSGKEDPHVYPNGYAVWARHSEPPLPLVLYVPHELGDEFEQAGRDVWRCRGMIVGWDHQHKRLQVKVLPPG